METFAFTLSSAQAIPLMILVTLMWGSWFQVVKHTGDFPVAAFITWLYLFSMVIVWGSIALFGYRTVPGGIAAEILRYPVKAGLVFFCGIMFAAGMQLHLIVVNRIGLILSTSVSATCNILAGTALSAFFGGLAENTSLAVIAAAALLLIAATVICQVSGLLRDRDIQKPGGGGEKAAVESGKAKNILILVLVNTVFLSFYTIAVSAGLKSQLRPEGFSAFTNMGILVLGAFAGSALLSSIYLFRNGRGGYFLEPLKKKRLLVFAFIAACCHFGGNVLQSVAAPFIGVAIAIPMGYSYHMWSYLWGLVYGEYRGAGIKTYGVLITGILAFVMGVVLLSINAV
jgi:hypothetical protein